MKVAAHSEYEMYYIFDAQKWNKNVSAFVIHGYIRAVSSLCDSPDLIGDYRATAQKCTT